MTEPFDLDALANEGTPFPFRFGGEDFEMPSQIDITAITALAAGDIERGFQGLIGPEQWARIAAMPQTFGHLQFKALLEAYGKHLGMPLGELVGSAVS